MASDQEFYTETHFFEAAGGIVSKYFKNQINFYQKKESREAKVKTFYVLWLPSFFEGFFIRFFSEVDKVEE